MCTVNSNKQLINADVVQALRKPFSFKPFSLLKHAVIVNLVVTKHNSITRLAGSKVVQGLINLLKRKCLNNRFYIMQIGEV